MITLLQRTTEDEMIAAFLRGEVCGRFRRQLLTVCAKLGVAEQLLQQPDFNDPEANRLRRLVLTRHRGWETRQGLCAGLPFDLEWQRAALELEDLRERTRYIRYFWEQFSDGTRSPAVVAARLAGGPAESLRAYTPVLDQLRAGQRPAEPILVAGPALDRLVILEGHVRITAYLLDPASVRFPLEVIIGVSPSIASWPEY